MAAGGAVSPIVRVPDHRQTAPKPRRASADRRRGFFSKSERVDYIKRLLRIEQAKAKERQGERTSDRNLTEVQRADSATAEQFGISSTCFSCSNVVRGR